MTEWRHTPQEKLGGLTPVEAAHAGDRDDALADALVEHVWSCALSTPVEAASSESLVARVRAQI